ncbi:MAG: tRNA pseudouridine(38-40) synthase TruA [Clostridia bacterium]|nr:tRNA pseudouridine(38-40) synthase TruA [Clostridia bacterium]
MRILLTVSYDGTDFCGYQIQPNGRTVEEVLNTAIEKLTGEKVKSIASGRTDSGVHALCQKVHFDTNFSIPPEKFKNALNSLLPPDVKVISSKKVSADFNARYSAKKKTYRYSLYVGDFEEPLYQRYKTLINFTPDISLMKKAGALIEGEHDFKCFLASGSSVKDTVRTVYSIKVVKKGRFIDIFVTGNGFLYNMVRMIAGALVKVGEGKLSLDGLNEILLMGERQNKIVTMPAKGLTLYNVNYK